MPYLMELAWVWGRFSIIRVQDKESDTKARYYPMERAGRLGYDHIYYEGDYVFLTNLWDCICYVRLYAYTPPGERNKLRPYKKKVRINNATYRRFCNSETSGWHQQRTKAGRYS